jgi:hypothetical protein
MNCCEYKNFPVERGGFCPAYPSRADEYGKLTDAVEQKKVGSKLTKLITGLVLVVSVFAFKGYAAAEQQSVFEEESLKYFESGILEDKTPARESFNFIEAEFREWFSQGESQWSISFTDPFFGNGGSKLEFQDVNSFIHMGTVRLRPGVDWVTLEGTMGTGDFDKGEMVDSDSFDDWLFSWSGWKDTWSESKSRLDGDITIIDAKMSFRVYPWKQKSSYSLDLFAGYNYYRERYHITEGKQTIPAFGAFDGLNSNYEFVWESFPVGLKLHWNVNQETPPGLYNLAVVCSMSGGPIRYRGEGTWNLRSDFMQNPSFEHEADKGYAMFGDFGIIYQPVRYISFKAGFQFYYFEADDGVDTTFFSDGTDDTTDLDKVKSRRSGPYASFSLMF